jgi:mannobiose 2-epimerase
MDDGSVLCSTTAQCVAPLCLLLLIGVPQTLFGQAADSLLDGRTWRAQGLEILSAWERRAQTPEGLYYAELDRRWTATDTTTQHPGMLARHLFSHSAAYLMGGDDTHLRRATTIFDFLVEHGWDERHGGWYNAVTRSGQVVDPSKDLFMQIYATTGLALYVIATRNERAQTYLDRSRTFLRNHAWDEAHGGYVDALNRDGSVKSARKDFSPQLAPLSGYLLYLYPATRDSTTLRGAERIMDLVLTHMQDERGWILERFAADWTFLPNDPKNRYINVGHNAEVAWLLLRLYALTGTERYRRKGLALTDKLLRHAFHDETGAWRHKLRRTDPSRHPDAAMWWVQAYGNMLQLYAYRVTGDERYLTAFRTGARFWTKAFVDADHGGTVLRTSLDGTVVDGDKAVRTKTSYHAVEHALLTSLYLDLWVNDATPSLHYRIEPSTERRIHPLPVEDTPRIERVFVNDTLRTPPDTADGAVRLPGTVPRPVRLRVDLSSSSAVQP